MKPKKEMPWLRLYSEIVDDEKLRLLAFEDRWHYIALLCCKRKGILDEGCDETLKRRKVAVKLGVQLMELEQICRRLHEVELIDLDTLQPTGWDGRQMPSDKDETAAERKRKQRDRDRNKRVTEESRVTGTKVTATEEEEEEEKEITHPLPFPAGRERAGKVAAHDSRFDAFWDAYPRKAGKRDAAKAWAKLKPDDALCNTIMVALERHKRCDMWTKDCGQFVPYPATYLRGERWTDSHTRTAQRSALDAWMVGAV